MQNKEVLVRLNLVRHPYTNRLFVVMVAMVVVVGFNATQAYIVKPLLDIFFTTKTQPCCIFFLPDH
ncbi:MAG: hypothetical protein CSA32_01450 [Desulfobulbus propionicus]|nr:MAG: hypothetical protein CSA32_01450 [Desulfobulbus propionicus]